MKIKKKALSVTLITVAVIACIAIAVVIFNNTLNQPYSGDGIYYSQQGDGKYLQFFKDKTFSYIYDPAKDVGKTLSDKNTHRSDVINNGTWEHQGNRIILNFTGSEEPVIFIETDGYIYREDTVFRGITSDAKLLKNKYLREESEDRHTEAWFFDDGTMSYDFYWGSDLTSKSGTYTRVDDILIVRYSNTPDVAHRFLVLENGISEDIYSKTQIK